MRNRISIFLRRLEETERSPLWSAARAKHIKEHPACFHCGLIHDPEVHHIVPFHMRSDLELDPVNWVTLGESIGRNCHLHRGHNGNWKDWNRCLIFEAPTSQALRSRIQSAPFLFGPETGPDRPAPFQ